jgi:seryl-tRNA synthetase
LQGAGCAGIEQRTMHDIRAIRENPEAFDAGLARRGLEPVAATILWLDRARRDVLTRAQEAQARRNEASRAIGAAMASGDRATADELRAEVATLKDQLPALEDEERGATADLNAALAALPQIPADDVPPGADEAGNVELTRWGTPRSFDFTPREHADLGPPLGLDFETGALLSGARFTFLRGQMARLHRALGQFMLDLQTGQHGYSECITPLLVRDEAAFGTGQLPKFADDLFRTTDGRWLIPTAEVSLTNSVRETILPDAALPMRLTALTPCFRSEAGAAGRDTRGFIRQHQFEKVELVSITRPEDSQAEHERMTACAEAVLQALDLPYRKVLLCSGDMGFTARKTYDLEVWLPGQGTFREISSCSNCGDFQARRMNARYRPDGAKATKFVHTLNGSGLAVGRTLVAVLENGQQADGSVDVPAVLAPYTGGLTRLVPIT